MGMILLPTDLELRSLSDIDNQTVDAMRGNIEAQRTAIQFHVKGATDGCLMSVGRSQFISIEEGGRNKRQPTILK